MLRKPKTLLIFVSHGPYGSHSNAAALDLLLAAGANQFHVTVIFCNDGVFSLLKNQNSEALQATDLSQTWQALPIYDIEKLYVLEDSLTQRDLTPENLTLSCELLSSKQLKKILPQYDFILRY